jgi:hypothetical protein
MTSLGRSIERRLHSIRVGHVKLVVHDHPSSGLTSLIHTKVAVFVREVLVLEFHEDWHHLGGRVFTNFVDVSLWARATIHEHIPFAAMSMEVDVQSNLVCFRKDFDHLFGMVDCWM